MDAELSTKGLIPLLLSETTTLLVAVSRICNKNQKYTQEF